MPQSRRTHVLAHLFLIMWKQSTLHYGRREKEWSSSNVQLNNSCHLLARTRMDGWMMEDFLLYFTTLTIDRFIVLHFTCFKLFICSWLYLCPTHSTAQHNRLCHEIFISYSSSSFSVVSCCCFFTLSSHVVIGSLCNRQASKVWTFFCVLSAIRTHFLMTFIVQFIGLLN